MIKLLSLLMLVNVSFFCSAKWEENLFNVKASYKFSNTEQSDLYEEKSDFHQFEISAHKRTLFQGAGVDFLGVVSPYVLNQSEVEEDSGVNHKVSIESALFLSQTSDFSLQYLDSKNLEHFSNRITNVLLGLPEELISEQQKTTVNYTLGKDRSFFYLNLQYSDAEVKKLFLMNELEAYKTNKEAVLVEMLWRQTEDTLWGLKSEISKNTREIDFLNQSFDIKNYYLSAVSDYLGNSQIAINLGSSAVRNKDQFSWDIEHKTYVSENFDFSLRSYRKFDQSVDDSELEELNTRYQAEINYRPLDYVAFGINFFSERRKRDDVRTYSRQSAAADLSFDYEKHWQISIGYVSEHVNDELNLQDISQNKLQFAISRTII